MVSSSAAAGLKNAHLDGDSFHLAGGPTGILLIHGFTSTTAEVRLLGSFLHEHGYTVSAPLLPGHGSTPEELNRCSRQDWVSAVEHSYQDLASQCEQVILGGASMGSLIAIHLSVHHPEIRALMLYSPALEALSLLDQLGVRILAPFVPYRTKPPVAPSAADSRWKGYTVFPLPAAVQFFHLQYEARRYLPLVRRPILIIQGRNDQRVSPSGPERILNSVQSTLKELHWLPNSGHVVLLDQEWEQAANLSLTFLKRVLT